MICLVIAASIITLLLACNFCVAWVEACYTFRSFIAESKTVGLNGGGYYSKLGVIEYACMRYLERRCELSFKKLPQGGYNVFQYNWKLKSK